MSSLLISKTPCGDTPPPRLARYAIYARETHLHIRSVLTDCYPFIDVISLAVWETRRAGGRGLCPSERTIEASSVNHLVTNLTHAETRKGAADLNGFALCR